MKTCSRCGETKELDSFSKRSSRPSGVQSKCKDCEREVRRQYYKTHEYARRRFKLTEDQYNDLMKNENCQICNNCNTALGLVGDNISTLQTMIEYLSKNPY